MASTKAEGLQNAQRFANAQRKIVVLLRNRELLEDHKAAWDYCVWGGSRAPDPVKDSGAIYEIVGVCTPHEESDAPS